MFDLSVVSGRLSPAYVDPAKIGQPALLEGTVWATLDFLTSNLPCRKVVE